MVYLLNSTPAEILTTVFSLLLLFFFQNGKLKKKAGSAPFFTVQIIYLLTATVLLSALCAVRAPLFVLLVVRFALCILFPLLFYQNPRLVRLFWGTVCGLLAFFAEFAVSLFALIFLYRTPDSQAGDGAVVFLYTAAYVILLSIFLLLLRPGDADLCLTRGQTLVFLLISILGMLAETLSVEFIRGIYRYGLGDSLLLPALLTSFFMLLFFIVGFFYLYQLGISNRRNLTLLREKKQLELEESQYQDLLELTRSLRELKHDLRFHLNTMEALIQNREYEKLDTCLQDYGEELDQIYHLVSTGNTAVDCTLSPRLQAAGKKQIPFDYSLLLPGALPIRDLDLSALLGNVIDNALTAAAAAEDPWIQLQIKPLHQMLSICIRNSFRETTERRLDPEHGLGLGRVREIVEKYGGTLRAAPEHNVFTVHILLPLEDSPCN